MKRTTPMVSVIAVTLLVLILPVLVYATGEKDSKAAEVTAVSELPGDAAEAPGGVFENPGEIGPSADQAPFQTPVEPEEPITEPVFDEPVPQSCTYRCPSGIGFECPSFPNTPPASCVNNCCNYASSGCQTTCSFNEDCGPLASCWSGCCYFWNG